MPKDKTIKQILKRIDRLEAAVFNIDNTGGIKKIPKFHEKNSLPELILQLRERGLFKQPKTSQEVHKKLQPIYPCDLNRVEVALLRLYGKRQLRKTSKIIGRKKVIAYVR